jgi:hypothetical protein
MVVIKNLKTDDEAPYGKADLPSASHPVGAFVVCERIY